MTTDGNPGGNSPQSDVSGGIESDMVQTDGGRAFENPEDEAGIILDQDLTASNDPQAAGEFLGGEGNDNPPLSNTSDFIRGEVDLVDQMNRTIRSMDNGHYNERDRMDEDLNEERDLQ